MSWRRRLSLRPGIRSDVDVWYSRQNEANPDWRFTESNEHYNFLYDQAQRAQFSPHQLRKAKNHELIFLAAHTDPVPIEDRSAEDGGYEGEGEERQNKLRQNAIRANAEMQRRWATRQSWINGFIGLVVGATLALLGTSIGDEGGTSGSSSTTTTAKSVTTTTVPRLTIP